MVYFWWSLASLLVLVVIYDVVQRPHAILRNFPVIGHLRYLMESIGPELRQYIVTDNDEERPFSRDQRRWVYASSKRQNRLFSFGSDNEMELSGNYLIIKHSSFPLPSPHVGEEGYDPDSRVPCAKILGGHRKRKLAFRPASILNVSGMSYGSLSGAAVEALNKGCLDAGVLQSTGEGGISPYHRGGADLVWQIGTGYFGCRDLEGGFDLDRLLETIAGAPEVRAIEVKLSQGAKPGAGGILPQAKITPEIAAIRGIQADRDCVSPAGHTAFSDTDGLLDFVELLAERTGLPVGIKSAVGQHAFWDDLAGLMSKTDRGVDFISIDGGEGGTGAGPLAFTDHVAFPFKIGFSRVFRTFHEHGLTDQVVFIGSGKLGFPEQALFGMALGCDMIAVAREALFALGCIQAQRCHTNRCPTGVTTQNKWLVRGLDPTLKAVRVANYIRTLRGQILALSRACGAVHPAFVTVDNFEMLDDRFHSTPVAELFGFSGRMGVPGVDDQRAIDEIMRGAVASA